LCEVVLIIVLRLHHATCKAYTDTGACMYETHVFESVKAL
jgi:hypothetical protein